MPTALWKRKMQRKQVDMSALIASLLGLALALFMLNLYIERTREPFSRANCERYLLTEGFEDE